MLKQSYDYWKGLPGWAKGIVGVTIIGGTALAVYSIWRAIKKNKELADANKAAAAASGELTDLKNKGVSPTLALSEFEAFSQQLVQAMNGCGTDNDQVYDVFKKMKNDADIRQLIVTFGVRYYQPCAASQPISYIRWQFNDQAYGGGLPTWLTYDMSASEIDNINTILKNNGVNYAF